MILVTGAAGKTGRAVMSALREKGQPIRALVHREEQRPVAEAAGAVQVYVGDMRIQSCLDSAAEGVRAVYHICPNLSPHEFRIGERAIEAARRHEADLFVFHSVLHPQTADMPHHWQKLRVEEHLLKSGLDFAILQPAAYMQNIHPYLSRLLRDGVYAVPYAASTRLGLVDLQDVAEVASMTLTESGHTGATYELAGPEVLTQTELAAIIGAELGIPLEARAVARSEWLADARGSGMGDYQSKNLMAMFEYYESFGFWGNPRVLACLLGRPPTGFAEFVRREVCSRPCAKAG